MIYDLNPGHIRIIDKATDLESYTNKLIIDTKDITPQHIQNLHENDEHRYNASIAITAYLMDSVKSSFKTNTTVYLYDTNGYQHYYRASTVQNRVYLMIPNIYNEHLLHCVKVFSDQLDPDADPLLRDYTAVTLKLFYTVDRFLDDPRQDKRKKYIIQSAITPKDPDLTAGYIWTTWKK